MTNAETMKAPRRHPARRGIILPVALLILGLLAVLAAKVVFRSNADVAAVQAAEAALKARLAAEAGVQKAIAVLQGGTAAENSGLTQSSDQPRGYTNIDAWYNNPDYFKGQIVQGSVSGSSSGVSAEAVPSTVSAGNPATWRFSVVASNPLAQANDTSDVRYGLTDEASRLNINAATGDQLVSLIRFVIRSQQVNAEDLAKAILYWRSKPDDGQLDTTEDAYYQNLDHPYAVKHAPFDSVEELLMVRGMTGQILFGEDWNRNGFLDANENDGDDNFPPDNGDGQLERGLYPFLTVWSSEPNTSSSKKAKIPLNNKSAVDLRKSLPDYYTDAEKDAIVQAMTGGSINSVPELLDRLGDDSTFSKDDLARLSDDFTTSKDKTLTGLVNINTAPVEVLVAVGFTEDEAHRIVAARGSLPATEKTSVAWLASQGIVDEARLAKLYNSLTARAFQFRVESVGFADHVGAFSRLEVVLKMKGHVAQVAYWRDLSSLGLGWPVHGQEGSRLAFNAH